MIDSISLMSKKDLDEWYLTTEGIKFRLGGLKSDIKYYEIAFHANLRVLGYRTAVSLLYKSIRARNSMILLKHCGDDR